MDDVIRQARRYYKMPRKITHQTLRSVCVILSAFVAWRVFIYLTDCESPIVVVLSGSMEPGIKRGDVLALVKRHVYEVGDIVVYNIQGRGIPIVHRVLNTYMDSKTNQTYLLTKGDNNHVHDRGLYRPGQLWLTDDDIMGTALGIVPNVGMVTIWFNDYPILKQGLIVVMFILLMMGVEV